MTINERTYVCFTRGEAERFKEIAAEAYDEAIERAAHACIIAGEYSMSKIISNLVNPYRNGAE